MRRLLTRIPRGLNPKKATPLFSRVVRGYAPGTYTFVAPIRATYRFVAWGPGAGGPDGGALSAGGAGGGFGLIDRLLQTGEHVTIVVGGKSTSTDTTITFADGRLCKAGCGAGASNGIAVGFTKNRNGGAGGTLGVAGSPGQGTGAGAGGSSYNPGTPGNDMEGGGGAGGDGYFQGGAGLSVDGAGTITPAGYPGGGGGGQGGGAVGDFSSADGAVYIVSQG